MRPLDRRREIADDGIEPDVKALVVVAGEWDGRAPFQTAGDRSRLQAVEQPPRERTHVRPPVLLRLEPGTQLARESRQVEVEVFALAEHRRPTVDPRPRLKEVGRVELIAAIVTLVP